ncbi:hypothetical protein FB567DRAFT_273797 [Paraphoma chrysanthemicola]|uniref:Uncharacterized protein n=1 Tax=Paraphoma chrysanthemicola TaxID=798071 RepID=A0A8K0W2M7_9PLEO|nr:hypothetical protein FB567DRAFT_273797 [Paraphoma chrysanthemicola]
MSAPAPFQFGAGAAFDFNGVEVQALRLRQELALARSALAAAHADCGRLGDELAAARAERDSERTRESIARACLETVRRKNDALESELAEKKKMDDGEYDLYGKLQAVREEATKNIGLLREQLSSSQKQVAHLQAQLEKSEQDGVSGQQKLENSRDVVEKIKQDLEHEKAAGAERDAMLNKAYADLKDAHNARLAALKAKDDMELQQRDTEMQFQDLHKQFEEERIRNEELEGKLHQIEQLDADNEGLQADIERLHEMIAEHDRTLIVKDERIAHLESQFQKERQRNLNAADAAAAAAATSPIDEAPPILPGFAESLADELNAASDEYDEFHYALNDYSDIFFTADLAPIEPTRPDYSSTVSEAASVAPRDAIAPKLTRSVVQAGSVTPIDAVKPRLDIHTDEAASVTPIDALRPELTVSVNPAGNVTPIDAIEPKLSLSVNEAGSVAPFERQTNTSSASAQTDAQDLTTEILHAATHEISPFTPTAIATTATSTQTDAPQVEQASSGAQTVTPQLTSSVIDSTMIAVAPVEAEHQRTTITLAPVTVAHEEAPLDPRPTESSTASTSAQTTEIVVEPSEPVTTPANTIVLESKPRKLGILQTVLPILAAVLAFFCLMLYTEVQAWRTANGVGFGYGHGGSNRRGGAYGNGRYLFGIIPLAMNVGNNWWSELIAKYSSLGITAFEQWAGISYEPLY